MSNSISPSSRMELGFPSEERDEGVSAIFYNLAEAWRHENYRHIREFETQLRRASVEDFNGYLNAKLKLNTEERCEVLEGLIKYCEVAACRIAGHADDQGHHLMHPSAQSGGEEDVVYVPNIFVISEDIRGDTTESDDSHNVRPPDDVGEGEFLDGGWSELPTSGPLCTFLRRLKDVNTLEELAVLFNAIQEIDGPSEQRVAADAWTRRSDDLNSFKKPSMLGMKRERP